MGRHAPSLRLFVAVYPARELVERWIAELAGLELPPHRAVPIEQVHLTLQFIGDTPAREVDRTIESIGRSASGIPAFELTAERLITLPQRGAPRLVAAETDRPPPLLELQRRLASRLATNVRRRQEFRPHLTLCRYRPGGESGESGERGAGGRVERPLAPGPFTIDRLTLMRSMLRPEGAAHVEVEQWTLGA